jgi:hypothetical protein
MSGNSGSEPSAKSKVLRPSAHEVRGDTATFETFMRRLMQVPHSEIKAQLDAEKAMKQRPKPFTRMADLAVRVSGVRPKRAN